MLYRENLLRNEFFPSELPPCFSTSDLADNAEFIITNAKSFGRNYSIPLKYSGFKSESSRRKFAIPNPYHYCKAVDLIVENCEDLELVFAKSKYSLTAPLKGKPPTRQAYLKRSKSIFDTKNSIEKLFQDNRYEIKLDISSFFDSIYTHSIPWALHGIDIAKKNKSSKDLLGNKLDKALQAMNYEQTNGILVGNAVSRIIAEIILCNIDALVQRRFPNIACHRFVDDYYIYTKDVSQIPDIISFIRTQLAKYELSFNENKIQINESPFLYGKAWVEQIKQYIHLQPDIFLSKLIMEYNLHKDIAILKYGIKIIAKCRFTKRDWPAMESRLINIWTRFPSLSEYIRPIFWQNKQNLNRNLLRRASYSLIDELIRLNREQELVWVIWFVLIFSIPISQKYVIDLLKSSNDVAIIITLDYIHKNGLKDKQQIQAQICQLYNDLAAQDVDDKGNTNSLLWTSHWLLCYEAERNHWLSADGRVFDYARKNQFFKELLNKQVKFYDSSFVYDEPENKTTNFEYATRNDLNHVYKKLKKLIAKRDALSNNHQESPQMNTHSQNAISEAKPVEDDEDQLYEELLAALEAEENVYFG